MTTQVAAPFAVPSEVTTEPAMNQRGQFQIKTPKGPRWYTRCTTYIKCLDDTTFLQQWKNRVIMSGLRADPRLQQELMGYTPDQCMDKNLMNAFIDRCFEAGDGRLKATIGTRLHSLAEMIDNGKQLPENVTQDELRRMENYLHLCAKHGIVGDKMVSREKRVVIDELKVTGTPDMVIADYKCLDGKTRNVIGDLKTKDGPLDFGRGEMALQLCMYSFGEEYVDDGSAGGKRTPFPVEVSREVGLILHVPQSGDRPPTLYEADLMMGQYGRSLAAKVREWRNTSKRIFTEVPSS